MQVKEIPAQAPRASVATFSSSEHQTHETSVDSRSEAGVAMYDLDTELHHHPQQQGARGEQVLLQLTGASCFSYDITHELV